MSSAKLVVVAGQGTGRELTLAEKVIAEIGRSPEADLCLDDPEVVSVHLKVYRENKHYHVFDLSGRGFLVNGRKRLKHQLAHGDLLSIGDHGLRFELHRSAPVEEAPVGTSTEHGDEDDEELAFMSHISAARVKASEPKVELHVIKGQDVGKVFDLRARPRAVIGRGIATDITLWDIRCSRVHCRVDGQETQFIVSDMNSSNGTFVNGAKISKPAILKTGDTIKIGNTVLQFTQI